MSYLSMLHDLENEGVTVVSPTSEYELNERDEIRSAGGRCLACTYENFMPRLNPRCLLCQSMTTLQEPDGPSDTT